MRCHGRLATRAADVQGVLLVGGVEVGILRARIEPSLGVAIQLELALAAAITLSRAKSLALSNASSSASPNAVQHNSLGTVPDGPDGVEIRSGPAR